MPLTSKQRRELGARGQRLKPAVTISADAGALAETVVTHVRALLVERELAKVRIRTDDRAACRRAAEQLAARVPCQIVRIVGRVALLYRADAEHRTKPHNPSAAVDDMIETTAGTRTEDRPWNNSDDSASS
jgi:RNA-binding protein